MYCLSGDPLAAVRSAPTEVPHASPADVPLLPVIAGAAKHVGAASIHTPFALSALTSNNTACLDVQDVSQNLSEDAESHAEEEGTTELEADLAAEEADPKLAEAMKALMQRTRDAHAVFLASPPRGKGKNLPVSTK